jgi:hypothetical protein
MIRGDIIGREFVVGFWRESVLTSAMLCEISI